MDNVLAAPSELPIEPAKGQLDTKWKKEEKIWKDIWRASKIFQVAHREYVRNDRLKKAAFRNISHHFATLEVPWSTYIWIWSYMHIITAECRCAWNVFASCEESKSNCPSSIATIHQRHHQGTAESFKATSTRTKTTNHKPRRRLLDSILILLHSVFYLYSCYVLFHHGLFKLNYVNVSAICWQLALPTTSNNHADLASQKCPPAPWPCGAILSRTRLQ